MHGHLGLCLFRTCSLALATDTPRLGSDYSRTTGIHSGRAFAPGGFLEEYYSMQHVLMRVEKPLSTSTSIMCTRTELRAKHMFIKRLVSHSLVRYVYMGKPRSSLRQIQCRFRIRTCLKFNVNLIVSWFTSHLTSRFHLDRWDNWALINETPIAFLMTFF